MQTKITIFFNSVLDLIGHPTKKRYCTASFNDLPALNEGIFAALIVISSPD